MSMVTVSFYDSMGGRNDFQRCRAGLVIYSSGDIVLPRRWTKYHQLVDDSVLVILGRTHVYYPVKKK